MEKEAHVAVLVVDTPIPGVAELFGDFGDNVIALLHDSPLPVRKYQVAYEVTGEDAEKQAHTDETLQAVARMISEKVVAGVVITGSRADSFAQGVGWIDLLDQFIRTTLYNTPEFPIVGVCFGHQILAKNLGCKVNRNLPEHGWEAGITTIALNKSILDIPKSPFRKTLTTENGSFLEHINLVEFHKDIVYGLPVTLGSSHSLLAKTTFQGLGSTAKCSIQGLITEEGPIKVLTFQGHPEFTTEQALRILEIDLEKGIMDKATFEKLTYKTKNLINQGNVIAKTILEFLATYRESTL